ncbi:MAG: hypothetical protein NC517_04585 [Firmicutes bacterium]|nr:hypothetical protein [Bacillota bacterium]
MQIHTGRMGYVEPLCGHAKSCLPLFLEWGSCEEILKNGIEAKAVSDECLAKSVAVT